MKFAFAQTIVDLHVGKRGRVVGDSWLAALGVGFLKGVSSLFDSATQAHGLD